MRVGLLKSASTHAHTPRSCGFARNIRILSSITFAWNSSVQELAVSAVPWLPYNASAPNSEIMRGFLCEVTHLIFPAPPGQGVYQPMYLLAASISRSSLNGSSMMILLPEYLN